VIAAPAIETDRSDTNGFIGAGDLGPRAGGPTDGGGGECGFGQETATRNFHKLGIKI
jgi:hypothetical protein